MVHPGWAVRFLVVLGVLAGSPDSKADDAYLTDLYLSLNDSPMQRKLRALRPFPVGVVLIQQRGQTLEDMKGTLATIKQTGFDSLKQIQLLPAATDKDAAAPGLREQVQNAALDVGLYPWYYGQGGWTAIDEPLLRRLGIPATMPLPEIQRHPAMLAHQIAQMRARVAAERNLRPLSIRAGEPLRGHPYIGAALVPDFARWLEQTYGSLERLRDAWHVGWIAGPPVPSFDAAARLLVVPRDADPTRDYRRYRDSMRFQADTAVASYDRLMQHHLAHDAGAPVRTGGHHLLDNQAFSGWDLEGQAHAAAVGGSFYASIHLPYHLRQVAGEIDRPIYLQARTVADMFKGGWAATWESTGGPTMWSGQHSYAVDAGLISRLMLTYVAAGLRGIGLWTWNARDAGDEGGEYALTDLNGQVTDRARAAGAIAQALQRHRFELWDSRGEPRVGVLYSWENEALLARLSLGAGPANRAARFLDRGSEARMGAARALMNANVPFELVTERDLRKGLGPRYAVILLPHMLALPPDIVDILIAYARGGGRVVADMPFLLFDDHGRVVRTLPGSPFETLFGAVRSEFRDTTSAPQTWDDVAIEGQYAALRPTRAAIRARFRSGEPALLEAAIGRGSAVIVNAELSRMARRPGHTSVERLLRGALGPRAAPSFRASGVLAHRRSVARADHYFLINDGPARVVTVAASDRRYRSGRDAVTDAPLAVSATSARISVPARSARWIRLERQ